MSNKKQTAVEWLVNELKFIKVPEKHNEKLWATFEKAKEIDKVNLKDAWHKGYDYGFGYTDAKFENSEQYYNENYEH
jgi:hypothetical protein